MFKPQWRVSWSAPTFDPREVDLMQSVFDAVWAMHEPDFVEGPEREQAREVLAKAIIADVSHSEASFDVLKNHALSELLRHRNR